MFTMRQVTEAKEGIDSARVIVEVLLAEALDRYVVYGEIEALEAAAEIKRKLEAVAIFIDAQVAVTKALREAQRAELDAVVQRALGDGH